MSVEMPSDAAMPSDVELNEVVGSLEESNDALTVDEMLSLHVGEVLSSSFKYFDLFVRRSCGDDFRKWTPTPLGSLVACILLRVAAFCGSTTMTET